MFGETIKRRSVDYYSRGKVREFTLYIGGVHSLFIFVFVLFCFCFSNFLFIPSPKILPANSRAQHCHTWPPWAHPARIWSWALILLCSILSWIPTLSKGDYFDLLTFAEFTLRFSPLSSYWNGHPTPCRPPWVLLITLFISTHFGLFLLIWLISTHFKETVHWPLPFRPNHSQKTSKWVST